jgi:hypothetical protein
MPPTEPSPSEEKMFAIFEKQLEAATRREIGLNSQLKLAKDTIRDLKQRVGEAALREEAVKSAVAERSEQVLALERQVCLEP